MSLEFFPHASYDSDERLRHIESFLSLFSGRLPGDPTSEAASMITLPGGLASGLPASSSTSSSAGPLSLGGDLSGATNDAVVIKSRGNFEVQGNFLVTGAGGAAVQVTDATTAAPLTVLVLSHLSTGTATAGMGTEVHFDADNGTNAAVTFGHMRALYAGGAPGSENGTFIWGSIMGGTKVDLLRFRTTVGMTPTGGIGGQVWCQADFFHSGNSFGIFNKTPAGQPGPYTVTNPTANRSLDESTATLTQVTQVLGTLVTDLQSLGIVG